MGSLLNLKTRQAVDVSELLAEAQVLAKNRKARGAFLILDQDGEAHFGMAGTYVERPGATIPIVQDALWKLERLESEKRTAANEKTLTYGNEALTKCNFPAFTRPPVDPRAIEAYEARQRMAMPRGNVVRLMSQPNAVHRT